MDTAEPLSATQNGPPAANESFTPTVPPPSKAMPHGLIKFGSWLSAVIDEVSETSGSMVTWLAWKLLGSVVPVSRSLTVTETGNEPSSA